MEIPLRHLIRDEVGTSALLAAALDPELGHGGQAALWRGLAAALGLPPEEPVERVACEVDGVDVLVLTASWCVVVENKIDVASVTPGQLGRYYRALRRCRERGESVSGEPIGDRAICIAYLTPDRSAGAKEFAALRPNPPDRSVHLAWGEVLPLAERAFAAVEGDAAALVRAGLTRVRELLAERADRAPKTVMDERRRALEALIEEIQKRVTELVRLEDGLKLTWWRDQRVVEFYGGIGGTDGGNVYCTVHASDSDATQTPAEVRATLRFQITAKCGADHSRRFQRVTADDWAAMLGVRPDSIELDAKRVAADREWRGTRADVVAAAAGEVYRWLVACRPLCRVGADRE